MSIKKTYIVWLRYAILGGLFASLFIPFIISQGSLFPSMFFPFITGKNFAFRILVEILLGLYAILALAEPKYRPRSSTVLWAVLAFVVWAGVATLFSVDVTKSFWSNFERMEGFVGVLHLASYLLVIGAMLSAENLWTRFLQTSVGASVLMSFYAIMQLRGSIAIDQGGARLDGTLGNAAYMAIYELFNIFFALFLLARQWNHRTLRWCYAGAIALNTFILFLTETRGTVLGLVAGLAVAAAYILITSAGKVEWKTLRKVSMFGLAGLVLVVGLFIAMRSMPIVKNSPALRRLASISLQDTTTQSRFMIWNMAWNGFKEKPLFGWGQENFSFVFNKYYNPAMYGQEQWFDRAHNAFLDWLTAAGAPGMLLFLSLFGTAVFAIARTRHLTLAERAVMIGLLAGYAVHEMFVFDNLMSSVFFFTVLALAHGISQRELPKHAWLTRPLTDNQMAVVAPIVIIATMSAIVFFNVGGIKNATGLVIAIEPPGSAANAPKDLAGNLTQFKTVLSGSPLGRQEATEQLTQFAISVSQSQSVSPDIKKQYFEAAKDALTKLSESRKGDARVDLFFGVLLNGYGQYKDALVYLLRAHSESPNKQQIYLETAMNTLIPAGELNNAAALLGASYELDHRYDTARLYYAAILHLNGQHEQADALLIERYGTATPIDDTLLQVYVNTRQYSRAQAMLEERVKKDPNDSQVWLRYAATYYASGDKDGAISILRRGAQLDPAFAKEADTIISQLQGGK